MPDVPTTIRRLPAVTAVVQQTAPEQVSDLRLAASIRELVPGRAETVDTSTPSHRDLTARPAPGRPNTSSVAPLSAESYKLQVTIARDTHDKLRRAQDLLRHSHSTGDVAALLDRALTLLLADLERRRCAAVSTPRASKADAGKTRHIPSAVKRAVWQRDQGRCAFVGATGRCREMGLLEFHHVEPFAEGGAATVENIQLRCRAHNLYEAVLWFGAGGECVREASPPWSSVQAPSSGCERL